MATFFGAPGEDEAALGLFGEAIAKDEAGATDAPATDVGATPGANADALAFAAQLAAPPLATPPPATPAPDGEAPTTAASPPPFTPVAPQDLAAAVRPTQNDALAAEAVSADAVAAGDVAVATNARTPDDKAGDLSQPLPGLNTPRAQVANAPPAVPPPVVASPVTPAPVTASVEALAPEIAAVTEPVKDKSAPARPGKTTDALRKSAAAPVGPPLDPALEVAPNSAASAASATGAAEDAFAIEIDATAPLVRETKPDNADAPDGQPPAPTSTATLAGAAVPPPTHTAVRGSPETVANLAAQIVKKLEGRSTRFDVELNPAGLGQVNVAVEIAANGKMTAAMSFETQHAANELRGRSADLQRALEQAGFDVSGGLSFDVAGDRGEGRSAWADQQNQQANGGAWRGRAFQAVLGTAGDAADAAAASALNLQRRTSSGVDVRI
ncbi:flagellar hook-length control protein FliK [Phenylobacterium sp.]|uniref:flagellar hook-length control protein FliK n=1 Tax=Phenylobacterium sp. TaxID=1871053 RepID=UPI00286A59C9|nr:flagellar hook-length control protein FliK [Phenylobacterium sp.]